jgi:hypothetical protein
VNTSEYEQIRDRLMAQENRRKTDPKGDRPTLRVAPGAGGPDKPGETPDERPTIKRRDLID